MRGMNIRFSRGFFTAIAVVGGVFLIYNFFVNVTQPLNIKPVGYPNNKSESALYDNSHQFTTAQEQNETSVHFNPVQLLHGYSKDAKQRELRQRLSVLKQSCERDVVAAFDRKYDPRPRQFFYSTEQNIAVCKTPKAGSTFWGKLFVALDSPMQVKDVFLMTRTDLHLRSKTKFGGLFRKPYKNSKGETAKTIIVSRNPYTRLFSAFIDKVFLLGAINRKFGRTFHSGLYKFPDKTYCGYHVTFEVFLGHVADMADDRIYDDHWMPISAMCDACKIPFDYVTLQETLTSDVMYIFDELQIPGQGEITRVLNSTELVRSELRALAASMLQDYVYYRQDCHSRMAFLHKFWISLQLQGRLHDDLPFPITEFKNTESADDVAKVIFRHMRNKPLSAEASRRQRLKALHKAYSVVDGSTLNRIKTIYSLDFLLFGYDPKPPIGIAPVSK